MAGRPLPRSGRKRRASVVLLERVYVSGGWRGLEIGLAPDDLVRLTDVVVAAIAVE